MTSGVYSIVNKINGHRYIGSSAEIENRWKRHVKLLDTNKHHSTHLQHAWRKYGKESFDFIVIIECPQSDLIDIEQKYLDAVSPEYNVSPTAGRTAGVMRSDEYKQKQSKSQRGKVISNETRERISKGMKGKRNSLGNHHTFTEEVKQKISNKLKGHLVSQETRDKIGAKNKGYRHTDDAKSRIGQAAIGNKYAAKKTK
jgi:group I intron endonuclease